ncbi:Mitogen-activated protein kinase-binding protein 1 [Sarcoptes scabiei]|uniref:Mitogen-activated protein kinase-binding protein 1 n=1 Tax=Sarcoptes scabiei TaxID=52283 RepID=A0A834VH95_SARSC|nr:Mitogen-activated protein kinase-binding protein 1 [Sarcoptes scabiei]
MSFIPAFQSSTIRRDSLQSIAYHQTNSNNNNNNNSNNNNDSNNNQPSNGGEWIATTERYESINNPFEDQSNNDCHQHQQSQQHQHHQQPLVDPFDGTTSQTRTIIRKLGLKRNSHSNGTIDSKKPITSCKFSKDGKYIVTGECGHQPQVRIWEVSTSELIASLSGHKYGINCVAFSPNGKYVVSIGSQHDMMVNVWDWRSNHIVASNKISLKVKSVSFAEQGDYFVTVGNRHVKFWYLEYNEIVNKSKFESFPLMGRNAILGDQRNNYFCDVQCGHGESKESTYVITKSGLLCEFNNRRLLNKWVELKTESAFCITLSQNYICVGCSQGLIRCFRPQTLEFVCTLPRPHSLGVDIAKGFTSRAEISSLVRFNQNSKPKYADTIAVVYDEYNKVVTAIYADRSIYFWSLNDIKRIGKVNSFLFHSSCIWDIDIYPFASKNGRNLLPPGTFLTCSSDDTIRIWNTEIDVHSNKSSSYIYKKNFFSSDLMKILYMDPELNFLCDPDLSMTKNSDRCGNIRIFDLEEQKDLFKIEAHDAEVLCLEYSNEEACGRALLVSASRDRFIHIFDVNRQYSCIQNIEDHSSSITAVKFIIDSHNSKNLQLISCGADKSLIFRKQTDPNSEFRLEHHVAGKSTFFDMAIDQKKNQIVTASQDRFIRSYDVKNGKNLNSFKGSLGDDGALIKIAFDSSATFIATSCTDKSIYIYDYQTGECLAATSGHSEIVTGLKFSQDGRHLISISGDGCIFVWRLPIEMTNAIASKLGLPLISDSSHSTLISNRSLQIPLQSESINRPNDDSSMPYRLNVSTLPTWARKQMFEANKTNSFDEKDSSKTLPRGRWAQRVVEEGHDLMNSGLVKSYASTFESMASKSTPTTPSGINSPNIKDTIKANNRLSLILSREPRAKSSLSSGVEDDDDDRNTTDSDNTYSQESSYKINKVQDRTNRCKNSLDNYSMISSISMANINDLPYDDDAASSASDGKEKDENKNYVSLYMSTENLERIDQRNRYLKNAFENIDKVNIDNTNSASDDSGINQIDHSLSSTTTNGTLTNRNDGVLSSQSQQNRRSISSRYNKQDSASPQSLQEQLNESTSDDATSSDIAEICNDSTPDSEIDVSGTKISTLDTIEESQTNNLNSVENDIEQNKNKSIDSVEKKISDNQNSPKEKDTDENLRSTIDSKLSSDLIEIENSISPR